MAGAPSLYRKLLIQLGLITLMTIVIGEALLYWKFYSLSGSIADRTLQTHAEIIAETTSIDDKGMPQLNLPSYMQPLFNGKTDKADGNNSFALALLSQDGTFITGSVGQHTPLAPHGFKGFTLAAPRDGSDEPVYVFTYPFTKEGKSYWLQVSEDEEQADVLLDSLIEESFEHAWWIMPAYAGILAISFFFTMRSSLSPLLRASKAAQTISVKNMETRLPEDDQPREILPLIRATNLALDRLVEAFQVQRNFTADAAHELRTPLSILRIRLEGYGDQKLLRDVDDMARLVEQLLKVAQLDNILEASDQVLDMRESAEKVVAQVAPMAIGEGKMISVEGEEAPTWVKGHPDLLYHALRNLLDNAIRHTPRGSTITVTLAQEGETSTLTVSDNGPGLHPSQIPHLFDRFWRADRTKSSSAGLGLAIVKEAVEKMGGSIIAENEEQGGASFKITLQTAPLSER